MMPLSSRYVEESVLELEAVLPEEDFPTMNFLVSPPSESLPCLFIFGGNELYHQYSSEREHFGLLNFVITQLHVDYSDAGT